MKNLLLGLVAVVALSGAAKADGLFDVRVPMDKNTAAFADRVQVGTLYNATTNETQFAVVTKVDAVKLPKVLNRQWNVVAGLTSGRFVNTSVGVAWNTPVSGASAGNVSAKPGLMLTVGKKL